MLKMLVAAVVLTATPAFAQPICLPLKAFGSQLAASGVDADKVHSSRDITAVYDYLNAIPLPVPDGSEPDGIILVDFGKEVLVAIIEPAACVAFSARVPTAAHQAAFAAAFTMA